jgi:hypothetical protein
VTGLIHPTVRVQGQYVYIGDGDRSEIRVYGADGRLARIVRSADPVQRISAADAERMLAHQSPAFRQLAAQWTPATHLAYSTFHVDPTGRLWVNDSPAPPISDEVNGWTAFDATGRLLGRLELPRTVGGRRVSVVSFGVNEVQLRWSDEDGFMHLSLHQIVSAPR